MLDLVGLDTMGHVAKNTYDLVEGDEEREVFKIPNFVKQMIDKKLFGNKSGCGFYKKEKGADGKTIPLVIDITTCNYIEYKSPNLPWLMDAEKSPTVAGKLKAVVENDDKCARYAWTVLAKFLVYAANRIPEIADTILEIDNAMKWGYNHQLGPFETWDALGVANSVSKMESEGMVVPSKVKKMLRAGNDSFYVSEKGRRKFYDFESESYKEIPTKKRAISLKNLSHKGHVVRACPSARLVDLGDGVFCCEFQTKMNALNGETVGIFA